MILKVFKIIKQFFPDSLETPSRRFCAFCRSNVKPLDFTFQKDLKENVRDSEGKNFDNDFFFVFV